MALGKEGSIRLAQVVDDSGNPARVSNALDGVYRLAVDAIVGGAGGAYAQGNFDSANVDETTATALWARAALTGLDSSLAASSRNVPIQAQALVSTGQAGIITLEGRQSGYFSSNRGRRFYGTHQTPGTIITAGSATFDATKPLLMIRGKAAISFVLRSLKLILRNSLVAQVAIAIDTADRFSAGGTALSAQNVNADSSVTFPWTSTLINPTATAAGGGTRYIWGDIISAQNAAFEIQDEDSVQMSGTKTILVYAWDDAGSVAPQLQFDFDAESY